MVVSLPMPHCHTFVSGFPNVCHSACVWPTALKLGYVTNLDMLFLVMGFISLADEIQFMLISSHHICIRSVRPSFFSRLRRLKSPSCGDFLQSCTKGLISENLGVRYVMKNFLFLFSFVIKTLVV